MNLFYTSYPAVGLGFDILVVGSSLGRYSNKIIIYVYTFEEKESKQEILLPHYLEGTNSRVEQPFPFRSQVLYDQPKKKNIKTYSTIITRNLFIIAFTQLKSILSIVIIKIELHH